ncbi:hypothetical protein Murru_1611 [Allomuricauda ruestringensis DSM 13258]|uniref:Uncharacterized protein n=2 Tax=Flagellimonas TaxID=444459 RepID=G2PI77_ALLRU|nr:hypothetical protein Murru_1611 [Allomuricauda ruestringensis DSM 13258]
MKIVLSRLIKNNNKRHNVSTFKRDTSIQLMVLILIFSTSLLAQGQTNKITAPKVYSTFDSIVGEQNMALYNGPIFKERSTGASDTHAYFLETNFLKGDIIFDEQPYFEQNLKYNVHLDELLITPKFNPTGLLVRLVKNKVKEFTIDGHRFIRLPSTLRDSQQYGYLEVLESEEGNLLLKKYRKKSVQSRRESQVITEYEESIDYILLFGEELIKANTKNQWNNVFVDQKKELRDLFKQNRIAFKTDKDTFFKLLFNKLVNPTEL